MPNLRFSLSQRFSSPQCFRTRHGLRRLASHRDLASSLERNRDCNIRTLQRPGRRARRQRLLQEWLENKEWLRDDWNNRAWADDLRLGEEPMTEERMTEEERECAADLMWAERAFKSGGRVKDRPRRNSGWERDEEVLPS